MYEDIRNKGPFDRSDFQQILAFFSLCVCVCVCVCLWGGYKQTRNLTQFYFEAYIMPIKHFFTLKTTAATLGLDHNPVCGCDVAAFAAATVAAARGQITGISENPKKSRKLQKLKAVDTIYFN